MPRPHKPRRIGEPPRATVFKPARTPARELAWTEMTLDEYEAIRHIDYDGLQQEEAAELMCVSRPTVTRILARGRAKLAEMLVTASALVIEGGVICPRERRDRGRHGCGRQRRRGRLDE